MHLALIQSLTPLVLPYTRACRRLLASFVRLHVSWLGCARTIFSFHFMLTLFFKNVFQLKDAYGTGWLLSATPLGIHLRARCIPAT